MKNKKFAIIVEDCDLFKNTLGYSQVDVEIMPDKTAYPKKRNKFKNSNPMKVVLWNSNSKEEVPTPILTGKILVAGGKIVEMKFSDNLINQNMWGMNRAISEIIQRSKKLYYND